MAIETKFNFVTLTYEGEGFATAQALLTLEGDWVTRAGLDPDVNVAVVPYTEFEKIRPHLHRRGRVQFWWGDQPGNAVGGTPADVRYAAVRVFDVEPVEAALIPAVGLGFGPQVVSYRLRLIDWREMLVEPRGGRLYHGTLNPDVTKPGGSRRSGEAAATVYKNSDLIRMCLIAMGVDFGGSVPTDADVMPPPTNLEWRGNHAPTELQKLLDWAQMAFVPEFDFDFEYDPRPLMPCRIVPMGAGEEPTFNEARIEHTREVPAIDRRGRTVIVSSEPRATIRTRALVGPAANTWDFVLPDPNKDGGWGPQAGVVDRVAGGRSPESQVRFDCADVQVDLRDAIRGWLFCAVQFSPAAFPPALSPILRGAVGTRGVRDPYYTGPAAIRKGAGWVMPATDVRVVPHSVLPEANVLVFPERLGGWSVNDQVADSDWLFDGFATRTGRITTSFEETRINSAGDRVPSYFVAGFRKIPGGVEALTEAEAQAELDEPGVDTVVVAAPQLARLIADELVETEVVVEDNAAELAVKARAIADVYLSRLSTQWREVPLKGFYQAELSGKVAEVRINQGAARTVVRINTWWLPYGLLGRLKRKGAGGRGGDAAYPGGGAERSGRAALGMAGETQPAAVVAPRTPPPPPMGVFPVLVEKDGGEAGTLTTRCTFTYTVKSLAGETIKTGVQLSRPRPLGKMVAQVGTEEFPAYGLAFWRRGELKLWDAGEVYDTGVC